MSKILQMRREILHCSNLPGGTRQRDSFVFSVRSTRSEIHAATHTARSDSVAADSVIKDNVAGIGVIGVTNRFGGVGTTKIICFE